jgi:hypothetical protein
MDTNSFINVASHNKDLELAKNISNQLSQNNNEAILALYRVYYSFFMSYISWSIERYDRDLIFSKLEEFWIKILEDNALKEYSGKNSLKAFLINYFNTHLSDKSNFDDISEIETSKLFQFIKSRLLKLSEISPTDAFLMNLYLEGIDFCNITERYCRRMAFEGKESNTKLDAIKKHFYANKYGTFSFFIMILNKSFNINKKFSFHTIKKLRKHYTKNINETKKANCIYSKYIPEYMLNEIDKKGKLTIRKHIEQCRTCINYFLELRMADISSKQFPDSHMWRRHSKNLCCYFIDEKKVSISEQEKVMNSVIHKYIPELEEKHHFRGLVTPSFVDSDTKIIVKGMLNDYLNNGKVICKEIEVFSGVTLNQCNFLRFEILLPIDKHIYFLFQYRSGDLKIFYKGFFKKKTVLYYPKNKKWYLANETFKIKTLYVISTDEKISDIAGKSIEINSSNIHELSVDNLIGFFHNSKFNKVIF